MKYLFYLPNYVPYSNGIKSLWYAAYLFSKHRETSVISFDGGEIRRYDLPEEYRKLIKTKIKLSDSEVVVYPDMVKGNPLGAKKIVRYLMAKPYILNGEGVDIGDNDFVISFSYAIDKNLPQFNILLPELKELKKYKNNNKKNTVLIYYGKCRISLGKTKIKKILKDFDGVKLITRTIPSSKEILYKSIAEASLFVSFDPLSSLAYEANLVGTPSLLLDTVFKEDYENFNHDLMGFYYDYDDISGRDLNKLGGDVFNNAHHDLNLRLDSNDNNALEKIISIEEWFSTDQVNTEPIEKNAAFFYNTKWEKSPIINCTTINTVIAYNLLRRSVLLFLFAAFLSRVSIKIRKIPKETKINLKKILRYLLLRIISHNQMDYIKYILHPENKKILVGCPHHEEVKNFESESLYNLKNGLYSKIWRMTCK